MKAQEIYGVDRIDMKIHKGTGGKCLARAMVFTVVQHELSIPYRHLGKEFNRNGKSIHTVVKAIKQEMTVNPQRRKEYNSLAEMVKI